LSGSEGFLAAVRDARLRSEYGASPWGIFARMAVNAADVRQQLEVKPGVHILCHYVASSDAWSARAGHPGAGRTSGSRDDTALHALCPAALDAAIRLLDGPAEVEQYDR
jgi:hypothetical protein